MPGRGLPNPITVLLGFVLLSMGSAGIGALLAWPSLLGWYASLRRPPGALPALGFPVCWAVLAVPVAVAAWRVWRSRRVPPRHRALVLWCWTLLIGLVWSVCFFVLHKTEPAIGFGLFSVLLSGLALRDFRAVDRTGCVLMAPSFVWVCYATWLTAGIAWLNPA
ncbi:tryptophan-rich sensory protein [Acetobacteraceae bacterium KSS8]|uniref:Tryptophan-rich sensory protein n=1 Tax=Endosaccharibacter trunci TaxID=2812733 RepID=A0ABT1W2D3_9PROT|nr:tryptophan-rich sensory protein [Acetobacteraceae bacterium KSS8]